MLATTKPTGPRISWLAYAALYRDPLGYLARAAHKHGDIVHLAIARRHDFLLNNPDYTRAILRDQEGLRRSVPRPLQRVLGRGLITSRGKIHKRQRALLQPVFQKYRIAALGEMMTREIARWSDRWRDGATVEMTDEMTRLSISIAGKTLFNVDLESEETEVRDALITVFAATRFNNFLLAGKLQSELGTVFNGRVAEVTDLVSLSYGRLIFAESMRLYPPVWIIGRHALRDVTVNGYVIPKGSSVNVSPFLMLRDARYFSDPERFDPERWTPKAIAARPRFSYFPFGGGGSQCIGEGLAWTQALLTIATLASGWRMRLVPGHRIELEPQVTLRSRYGMPIILERRK